MLAPAVPASTSLWRSLLDWIRDTRVEVPLRPDYATPGAIGDARLRRRQEEERRALG